MAYVDELRQLLVDAELRLNSCQSDAAYAAILRQVRGLKADIQALDKDDDGGMDDLLDGCNAVR